MSYRKVYSKFPWKSVKRSFISVSTDKTTVRRGENPAIVLIIDLADEKPSIAHYLVPLAIFVST